MKLKNKGIKPSIHFAPKKNWINDPNGLVYFEGEYHLFYQYNPVDVVHGPMFWGHAISKDLIKWEELDIALSPDHLGEIYSGSAIVDWNNTTGFFPDDPGIVAIFTHHRLNEEWLDELGLKRPESAEEIQEAFAALKEKYKTMENPSLPRVFIQEQSLAYSHDKGRTWTKYEGNPVLSNSELLHFRDPKVIWDQERNRWLMVLVAGQSVHFYSSNDLKEWKFESEFGNDVGYQAGVWECPDIFELPVEGTNKKKWILIVSVGDNLDYNLGSSMQYFVGSFDGQTFTPEHEEVRWFDYGRDNYAAVSFSDIPEEDGRRIFLGWMSNWRYANEVPTEGWRGQMTIPRQVSLIEEDGETLLKQLPVSELTDTAENIESVNAIEISNNEKYMLELNQKNANLDFRITKHNCESFTITFVSDNDEEIKIQIDFNANVLTLYRAHHNEMEPSGLFNNSQELPLREELDKLNLQVVLDTLSIELFTDNGLGSLTSLLFPEELFNKVIISNVNGELKIDSIRVSNR